MQRAASPALCQGQSNGPGTLVSAGPELKMRAVRGWGVGDPEATHRSSEPLGKLKDPA